MKAAFLIKPKTIELRDIPIPEINDEQVLVKIKEVGLCGSDVNFYNTGRVGDLQVLNEPIILGHESSGEVVKAGKSVQTLMMGDRVSIEPGVPCYKCDYCKTGNYNLCEKLEFLTIPPVNGAFCEYLAYDPNFLYKLPDNVTYSQAAMVEPLSVGFTAAIQSGIQPGSTVCILGCGPVGLACLEFCRAAGASKIFVTDIDDYNLSIAKKHGAFKTINTTKEDLVGIINKNTDFKGVEVAIEAVGIEKTVNEAMSVAKRGGTVSLIGCHSDLINISLLTIVFKGIKINGIFRYRNTYKKVIELLSTGIINFEDFVSHRFSIDEINKAFEKANDPTMKKMKIIITL